MAYTSAYSGAEIDAAIAAVDAKEAGWDATKSTVDAKEATWDAKSEVAASSDLSDGANLAKLDADNTIAGDNTISGATTFSGSVTIADAIIFSALPTTDPEVAGQLWIDTDTLKISAGPV